MNQEIICTDKPVQSAKGQKAEKRICHRPRQFKGARILIGWENSTIDCILRDITDAGARLQLSFQFCVPNKFDLVVVRANDKFGCEIVWRQGNDIGVKFV
ncbi:MAG: PilZ domain-containing protein [Rhizobiaceae bacterium]|nr:PilZ domain-containing protein [Rhizobiaceae bacterium]